MNSQIELLRKTLERLAKDGAVKHNLRDGSAQDIRTSYGPTARSIAENLLEQFPEEDSENVQAVRAAYTLIDYIDSNGVDQPDPGMGRPLDALLFSLINDVQPQAQEDIQERLLVEENTNGIRSNDGVVIRDPVSKITQRAIAFEENGLDVMVRKKQMAANILRANE